MRTIVSIATSALAFLLVAERVCLADQVEERPIDRILREFHDPKSKHVLIVAHRGGWRHAQEYKAPENSLANIHKAVRLGYDVFETDVSRTKDGHLILMHDPSVARTTNGTDKVRDMTLAEIKKLRLRYSGKKLVTDQTVPTFKEALLHGKDRIMFKIDLKFDVSGLAAVLDELHDVGTMKQAMIRVGYRGSSVRKVKEILVPVLHYSAISLALKRAAFAGSGN